jgi:hypothetical protein
MIISGTRLAQYDKLVPFGLGLRHSTGDEITVHLRLSQSKLLFVMPEEVSMRVVPSDGPESPTHALVIALLGLDRLRNKDQNEQDDVDSFVFQLVQLPVLFIRPRTGRLCAIGTSPSICNITKRPSRIWWLKGYLIFRKKTKTSSLLLQNSPDKVHTYPPFISCSLCFRDVSVLEAKPTNCQRVQSRQGFRSGIFVLC